MGLLELIADVTEADAAGPVCDHWLTPLHHHSVRLLADLGLVKPVATRIPACSEHWCPLAETCPHRSMFEEKTGTRGGIKAKLTPSGRAAFADPDSLSRALASHRLAGTLRAAIAEGPRTLFDLHTLLLQACFDEVDAIGRLDATVFHRSDLRGCLHLLESLGEVIWDRETGCVSARPRSE